jgi:hypothetical protein
MDKNNNIYSMRIIKFFEEFNHHTYMSAADKLKKHGQKDRANKIISHSVEMESKKISTMSFDILVGPREFPGAKYEKTMVMRESGSKGITFIFTSGNNTHRILTTVSENGGISWRDGNKFANRKSVNDFQKLVSTLSTFDKEIIKLMDEMNLTSDILKVISRTFYN